jgi:hypothetical protein
MERGGPSVGKVGECDVTSRHLQGCSPCLCRLRADGLAPVSKYWTYWLHAGDMGLVNLVAYHQQVLGLSTLLQWLCWERNWGRSRGPLGRAKRWSQEHFFSRAVHLSNSVDDSQNVAMCGSREIYMVEGHTRTEHRKCVAYWSGFPYRVYIDSNHRDSRKWVTTCLRPSTCSSLM